MTPPLVRRPDPPAASLATALCQSSTPRATRTRSPPPWQPSTGWRGPMRQPAPPAGTNKTSPPSFASRTAENRPPGMHGMHPSGEQSGRPRKVTNGRGSAKQAVPRTACFARTLSAYLHRRGDRKWLRDGPFTVLGRASLCSLALIAAGSCERAAGSGGAKRPRSDAAGALDAAARERIMAGGGKGANLRRDRRFRDCWRSAFLAGIGVTCSMTGRGAARGSQAYLGPRALCRARRHDDRLGVLPPAGGAAAQCLYRPSAWPCAAGPVAADSGLAGAGHGYAPSGEFGSGSPAWPAAPGWPPWGAGLRRR